MSEKNTRQEALQMSRDLTRLIEQQQQEDAGEHHVELGDCIKLVAYCVWDAAWRQARADHDAGEEASSQVEWLIHNSDFLKNALHRHNWRNVSAILSVGVKSDFPRFVIARSWY